MSAPWPHLTVAVPSRLDGWIVVAACKLPSGGGKDRYTMVVEASGGAGYQHHPLVTWIPREGFKSAGGGPIEAWTDAIARFVSEVVANVPDFQQ